MEVTETKRNQTLRKLVLKRDYQICRACGFKGNEVHHIVLLTFGGRDEADNMVCLCTDCHREAPDEPKEFDNYCRRGGARLQLLYGKTILYAQDKNIPYHTWEPVLRGIVNWERSCQQESAIKKFNLKDGLSIKHINISKLQKEYEMLMEKNFPKMKISINKVKTIPNSDIKGFCVFGYPSEEVQEWIEFHELKTFQSGNYTNIEIGDKKLTDLFEVKEPFEYLDGFSPNLNKHLHIGHWSNLVLAKAFQSLGIANKNVSILGDTVTGDVSKEEALNSLHEYCTLFGLKLDDINFASEIVLAENIMTTAQEIMKALRYLI